MGKNGERQRGDASATPLAVGISVVKEHTQCWNPAMGPQVEALQSSVVEGVDGAISFLVADERNRVLGQGLSPDE